MKIKLKEKYKPYSHEVGTACLLPKSSWKVTAYPTRIDFQNLLSQGLRDTFSVKAEIQGPLSQFTVMQDLENKWVRVFGRGPEGFFSYRLVAASHEIILFLERSPKQGVAFTYEDERRILKRKEELIMPSNTEAFPLSHFEKVHFGCHKAQDWTLVKRRLSLDEILPIWFELGKNVPEYPKYEAGTAQLLTQTQKILEQNKREKIGPSLLALFKGGFEGILVPRLEDTDYQGFSVDNEEIPNEASPMVLLGEGARLIRRLFLDQKEESIAILPCLPVELHAGRIIDAECGDLELDLEWSKKLIRRLTLRSKVTQTYNLKFQSPLKSFRLRKSPRDRGIIHLTREPLALSANVTYMLDRFQK